jgi:hypothetical protein
VRIGPCNYTSPKHAIRLQSLHAGEAVEEGRKKENAHQRQIADERFS